MAGMSWKRRLLAGAAAAALAGCLVGCAAKYRVVSPESESPVLDGDCPVRLLDAAPETGFTILGEVKPEDPQQLAETDEAFLAQVRAPICRLTGDAVIVHKDAAGRIGSGTVIRMR